ncbi:MAG: T9SS type A sorting domain-containing protein [Bacteroidia bacterium]|nr:T9SS type A sorting domain-containing protein [Bacteroidia bacterium]
MLRKLLYSTALFLSAGTIVFAQADRAPSAPSSGPQNISEAINSASARKTNPSNQVNTLFDVQFNHDASTPRGTGGLAGVCWTGTEFWVSAWNADSVFTYDTTGAITSRFIIPGVGAAGSGIRAMTWDGTSIFAGINTGTIYEINPVTKTMVATITAPLLVRGIAYDSTANSGAGGFWISNYDTDITLISRTGTVLNSIPASTHGLIGMYGIALDNYSTGGPYIWAFDQNSSASTADLRRINIATGMTDMILHDVMADIGATETSGLAGGLAITWGIDPAGSRSIIGVMQSSPNNRLFGYELNDFVLPAYDASAEKLNFNPPVTFVPEFLVGPTFWDLDVANTGANTIDTLNFTLNVDSAGVNVSSETSSLYGVASGATNTMSTLAAYTPAGKGEYNITATVNSGILQADLVSSNDTIMYDLTVTDSTIGIDNNFVESSLGIGTPGGVLGQKFTIPAMSYASSVSFFCVAPTAGDSVSADLYTFTSSPGSVIASTYTYIFTAADEANGVFVNLGFMNAPYQIAAGTYFVGVKENGSNMSLAYTSFNFQNNTGFAQIPPSAAWLTVESASFLTTFILRLNVLDPLFVSVPQVYKQDVFTMHPNPASNQITVKSAGINAEARLSLLDITGREVYSRKGVEEVNIINLNEFSEGVYFVRMIVDGKVYSEKITIAK